MRLIEHSHVAPPAGNGAAGTEEMWKFAALGAGTTEIAFQRGAEKPITFKVVVRGTAGGSGHSSQRSNNAINFHDLEVKFSFGINMEK